MSIGWTIPDVCPEIWLISLSRSLCEYQSVLFKQIRTRFSICPSRSISSCSLSRSGPSTTTKTISASSADSAAKLTWISPSTSPMPGVSTRVTLSIPLHGISFRVTVVPPRTSVLKTSRPANKFKTEDLPLLMVPNATISNVCCSRLASISCSSGSSSDCSPSSSSPSLRRRSTSSMFSSISRSRCPEESSLGLRLRRARRRFLAIDAPHIFQMVHPALPSSRSTPSPITTRYNVAQILPSCCTIA